MGEIVALFKKTEQTAVGEAFCIQCKHTWIATAPTGVVDLECPECGTFKGKYKFEFTPQKGTFVRECNCGNQLFYLTPDGICVPTAKSTRDTDAKYSGLT